MNKEHYSIPHTDDEVEAQFLTHPNDTTGQAMIGIYRIYRDTMTVDAAYMKTLETAIEASEKGRREREAQR